jgi:hypothetical protein
MTAFCCSFVDISQILSRDLSISHKTHPSISLVPLHRPMGYFAAEYGTSIYQLFKTSVA